ncbi:MAG TPA: PBP1A family penicillin-binding protein [Myxococcota bacterium]|jgi:penicillin-binding protein 1B
MPRPKPRTPRKARRGAGLLRVLALTIASAGFFGGFVAAGYFLSLDRSVRARFDGRRFEVPSRVFSTPSILYPGLDWKLVDLRGTLARLGFREAAGEGRLEPGEYAWGESRARVHLQAFEHPTRSEPARDVVLRLNGSVIQEIRELPSGRELGAVLLEPEPIGAFYGPAREQRELVKLEQLPPHLVGAILAVEDQRFEAHRGIDLRRIAGALLANLRAGAVRQGGSTVTQQLVKNFFLTPERTLKRKFQEAAMALVVEARYDKHEILEAYLNEIYLGQRGPTAIHGVGEAAHVFFGKSARELGVAESALLAAVIHSPNGLSPYREPERAVRRRNLVLEMMEEQGRLDAEARARAQAEPLRLAKVTPDPGDARYFLDLLRRQLSDVYDASVLETDGLRIYSTLDRRAQRLAAIALREGIADLEKRYPRLHSEQPARALQGCLVALRPQTGELLALVGGRDYATSQFDRCTQARRQTGSAFKPFAYAAALEPYRGAPAITLASLLDDSPLEISTPSGPWRPENYDKVSHGMVTVRQAIERSLNIATARLARDVGPRRIADLARRTGIQSSLPIVPSLALGVASVAPIEIARAYATFASGGIRPELQSIEDLIDAEGRTLDRRKLRFERVMDAGTAYLVTSLLEGVAEHGTASALRANGLRGPIAAKTGTTDREQDLWLVGYTPELVVVVWIGFDEPRSLKIPSAVGALPIWRRFVTDMTGGQIRGRFPKPASVEVIEIDPVTRSLAASGCPERKAEYFLAGTAPTSVCGDGGYPESLPGGGVAERPPDRKGDDDGGEFFRWLRRHL